MRTLGMAVRSQAQELRSVAGRRTARLCIFAACGGGGPPRDAVNESNWAAFAADWPTGCAIRCRKFRQRQNLQRGFRYLPPAFRQRMTFYFFLSFSQRNTLRMPQLP